ncbi:MAG TPA: PA14 domain-containing protein [Bryobacteraceae bacterium]|nr:PA14 domain-containing protein [Bryobacteraceae bacterium]
MQLGRLYSACLSIALVAGSSRAQDKPEYVFGTTVVDTSGLHGRVYYLKTGAHNLPKFDQLRPIGSIYTTSLNVWPQTFDQGFPSITDRFEWFAIEYTGRIWIENSGQYRFSLLADDGARLYLNDKVVVDNGGAHGSFAVSGSATLSRGIHEIKVEYYQGPRYTVALVLAISPPGQPWRIFNTNDFKPPNDPDQLQKGGISNIGPSTQ